MYVSDTDGEFIKASYSTCFLYVTSEKTPTQLLLLRPGSVFGEAGDFWLPKL